MAAHLCRARHHQADLPARLAQFKRQVNRGILTRGGGRVSRGRLTHVILQGKRFRLAPNPYPLTARRPIASEPVEGRTGGFAVPGSTPIVPAALCRYGRAVLELLKANNRAWAERMRRGDAEFFRRLEAQQAPEYLWI